jgi:outer membrane receptor protein involved in Fe transport
MMRMKLLFTLIISLISLSLFSQQVNEYYKVTGSVHDADSHSPLQFVTVTLQDIDSNEITGDVTNKKGEFELNVAKGNYYYIVESLSFNPFIIRSLSIDQDLELGTIELNPNFEKLDEVEVVAKSNLIDYKFAKKIYNASKDIANVGGNAITVLENTPSVRVDDQGEITIKGNIALVLVNGKPFGGSKSNADVLSLIPANTIKNVEIISQSTKYDAEGGGGILNIILKKRIDEGYDGTIEVHGGIPDNDGVSTFINYKTEKINIFSTASFNHLVKIKDTDIDQIFLDDNQAPTGSFDEIRNDNRQRNSFLFNLGSDFYIDKKNTLTTSLLFSSSNKNYDSGLYLNDYQPVGNLIKSTFRDADDNTDETFLEAFINYTSKFNKEGHEIGVSFNYNNSIANNNSFITNFETFPGSEISNQKYIKNESVDNYYMQLDYVLPIKDNSKLEVGHKSSFRIYENDFTASNLNPITNVLETIPEFSSVINYDESIYAFYFNFSKEMDKISYSFGLRTEITKTEITEKNTNQVFQNNYTDLFPSAIIGYNFNNKSNLSVNYSKYIDRPTIAELNPFNSFTDERFILVGNPFLNPYYTNYFQLEYYQEFEKITLISTLFYSNSTDRILNVLEKTGFQTTDGFEIYRRIPINNGTLNYSGIEVTATYSPTKKIKMFGLISPYYSDLSKTRDNAYDFTNLVWYGNFRFLYRITNTFRFQIDHFFQTPIKTAITELDSFQYTNLTMSKDFFEGKATLTFKINDVFYSRKAKFSSLEANTITNRNFIYDTQYLLSFSYRFNKANRRNSNNRTKDMEKDLFEIKDDFK